MSKSVIRLVAAAAASLWAASGVSADGLPERQREHREHHHECANFHGFYVGANAGWANLTAHQNNLDAYRNNGSPAGFTATDDSFTGGIQAGFNLQRHCTVFGLEADWNWVDLKADTRTFPNTSFVLDNGMKTHIESIGTLRTRAGTVQTVHLRSESADPEDTYEVWLAPGNYHLPVKLKFYAGRFPVELIATSIRTTP